MNIPNILNRFHLADNIAFYPLLIMIVSYSLTVLLALYYPKNRSIYIFMSISKVVSIICLSANAIWQILTICSDPALFRMFGLFTGGMILSGFTINYKVQYIFISHIISCILHACFYYYCKVNPDEIISGAFHPSFEYLITLSFVYLLISWFNIKIGLSIQNEIFMDRFLPQNESSSHKAMILLQAYSMIIHSTFMGFMYSSTFDYWFFYAIVFFVILLQLIIVIVCLRIMYLYPSSANAAFYVSAYLMIIKTLMDSVYTNIDSYIHNKPFNVQSGYSSNKLIYLFVYILVICILSIEVAYAADEIEEPYPSSPIGEGQSFSREAFSHISQSGAARFSAAAFSYETLSYVREWFQDQLELRDLKEEFESAVVDCNAAKERLESIEYKYSREQVLINKAEEILKHDRAIKSNPSLDADAINEYKNRLERLTIDMNAQHQTYTQYKGKTTDYVLRRVLGITNCCSGPRTKGS